MVSDRMEPMDRASSAAAVAEGYMQEGKQQ